MKTENSKIILFGYVIPLALLLINFVLKIAYLSYGDVAADEPFTIYYAQTDFTTLFNMLQTENNPPLFFILLHYWIKLFGISSFSTRFLPLLFSTLTVLFIYKTGRKFFNLRVAIVASLIFTFSNYHIYFAHDTRVYTLFALLTTVSMFSFLSLQKDKSSKKFIVLLIISNVLLIYSHFFGFFVIMIQGVSLLVIKEFRTTIFKKYTLATIISLVLYSPYIGLFLYRFSSASGGTWISPPNIESLYNNLWIFSNAPVNTVVFLVILAAALIVFFIKQRTNPGKNTPGNIVILIWFFVPYLFMFSISFLIPMFIERYLVYISIGYYLMLAIAINFIANSKWLFYSLSIVSVAMMIATCNPKNCHKDRNKELVTYINNIKTPQTIVFLCPNWIDLTFVYYYNPDYFKDFLHTRQRLKADLIFPVNNADEINDSLFVDCDKIIFIDSWSELVDPGGSIFKKLSGKYNTVSCDETFKGSKIYQFSP